MKFDNDLFEKYILPCVERPGQYAGGELGSVVKDWEPAPVRMVFCFPDTYEIGMSHLGLRLLYESINNHSPYLCERAFMPLPDMYELLRRYNQPLFSLESRHALADFDVLGFTLQYELSFTNILAMLDLSGIPLMSCDRNDSHPLIIAGGPCAYNPEPLAEIIDLFVIGEGEEVDNELLALVEAGKQNGWSRDELLRRSVQINGVYVPRFYRPQYKKGVFSGLTLADDAPADTPLTIKKRILPDMDSAVFPHQPLLPNIKPVHDRIMLEVMRGCTHGCRFCQAGMIYRPRREKSPAVLRRQAEDQVKNSGYDDISLLSLSTADYSCIERLMRGLLDDHAANGVGISLPSLRVDEFSVGLAASTQAVRKSGITLAPEAGSQRMRDVVNKGVTEEDILTAAASAFSQGYSHIKLYFMLGLPYETDSDVTAIAELCRRIIQIAKRNRPPEMKKPLHISLGVSSFVPKTHTPFQWQPQDPPESLQHKQELLREHIRQLRSVTLNCHDRATSLLEAAFARGDRRLNHVLLEAYNRGCIFDGWNEHFHPERWREAFAACGLSEEEYAQRQMVFGEPLPWSHIDCGVSEKWLWQENIRAGRAELTSDCSRERCNGCGVCDGDWKNKQATDDSNTGTLPRVGIPQAEDLFKYRCRLEISGTAVWLSQLDLLGMMEKTLRRSGLPMAYTQGFNPHFQISWGPAHPVGLASESEYVDLLMSRRLSSGWENVFNQAAPPGLRLLAAHEVELTTPALMSAVEYASYRVRVEGFDADELDTAIADFLAAPQAMVERISPKGRKMVDLRQAVEELRRDDDELIVTVRLNHGAVPRMPELVKLLAPSAILTRQIRTSMQIVVNGVRQTP